MNKKYGLLIAGIIIGIAYGLITRIVFGEEATLASISYLFLVPTVLGIVPLMFARKEQLISYRNIIFIPWLTVATFFLTLYLSGIEDFICLLILAAPFFIMGTIGAFIYRLVQINRQKNKGKLLTIFLFPFLLAPVERFIDSPSEMFEVESSRVISAPAATVWNHIIEVSPISESEYHAGFFQKIGIPRPVSATVSRRGIGGTRVGKFEGGLKFIETITVYAPESKVDFDIKVDTQTIGDGVFNQHVLNGNYFNFVDAEYEIIPLSDGDVMLKLSSHFQLTSKINFYGKFWGDLILKDFQDRLLDVIKSRCEVK